MISRSGLEQEGLWSLPIMAVPHAGFLCEELVVTGQLCCVSHATCILFMDTRGQDTCGPFCKTYLKHCR